MNNSFQVPRYTKHTLLLMIAAIILVALNLRPSMTAIGPLLKQIQATITVTYTQVSLFTMLPIVTMGIGMFIGNKVKRKLGLTFSILLSLILIMLATAARVIYFDAQALIITAIISGLGIAIIQALIPVYIKMHFTNVSIVMGLYVTAIMGGATLSASLSPLLSDWLGHWKNSFIVWALMALVAVILWFWIAYLPERNDKEHGEDNPVRLRSFFTNKRAWLLALFFGLGTSVYTCILAWFAPYYLDLGYSQQQSGLMMAYLTILEVAAGLIMPAISASYADKRPFFIFLLSMVIVGFLGMIFLPETAFLLWPALLGFGSGGVFPMSLIVSMEHIDNPNKSGALTAFVQGIGYILAGFSPVLAGYIRAQTNSFELSWVFLTIVVIVMMPMALLFNPKKYQQYIR